MVRSTSSSGVRRQDPQLPTNHEGMELHRAPDPPTSGNPRRYVEISVGAARVLSTLQHPQESKERSAEAGNLGRTATLYNLPDPDLPASPALALHARTSAV